MIEIGGNQRARGEYGGWSRTSQSSCNNFCQVIKTHEAAHCPDETRRFSDSLFLDFAFCSIAVFNSSNWEQYFSEFIVSLFSKSS